MKKILSVITAGILLTACTANSYKVNGQLEGVADSVMVSLNVIEDNALAAIDSTMAIDGKFSFAGETEGSRLAFITFNSDQSLSGCQFFLENGKIKVEYNDLTGEQSTTGTPNNDAFQDFYDKTSVLNDKAQELKDKLQMTAATEGDGTDLVAQMNDLQDEYRALLGKSISDNLDKEFGFQQLLQSYDMFEPEDLSAYIQGLMPLFGDRAELQQLAEMTAIQMRTANGSPYLDFECDLLDAQFNTPTKASLSDYVSQNKLTLLDFWASWCSPCMNEVPYIKAAYEKYAEKGFTVVSVSVDEDINAWKNAVKENEMTWVHMWNGLEDLENSAAMQYAVSAIPSSFLIDADGTIIGRNLRGEELEAALADYFK